MAVDIEAQIARLPHLSRQQLLDLWHELYGRAAPPKIRRSLLIPFLAYRLQEQVYGGLKPPTRTELRRLARAFKSNPDSTAFRAASSIKPGTRLMRTWKGKNHEVNVTESGFEHGGEAYRSLSQIARKITGTQWSGPAFFGMRKQPAKNESAE